MFSQKGYAFIMIVMITMGLISATIILSRNLPKQETITKDLVNNYNIEFSEISRLDKNTTIINNFQISFINFVNAQNHNLKLCSIFADEENYYVSNYLGKDCMFVIDDVNKQMVSNNSTTKIDRFINETNIYLCNCEYKNFDSYYINLYDSKNQIIKKNMR